MNLDDRVTKLLVEGQLKETVSKDIKQLIADVLSEILPGAELNASNVYWNEGFHYAIDQAKQAAKAIGIEL